MNKKNENEWRELTLKNMPNFGENVLVCGHGQDTSMGVLKAIKGDEAGLLFLFYGSEFSGQDPSYEEDWCEFKYWMPLPKEPTDD